MESVAERRQRVKRLEETRRKRRGDAVWPTPDSSGLDISPAQIAPGRGDLTRPVSGYAPPIPTALRLLGRTVSFHRIYMEQPWVAAAVRHQLACATRVPLKAYRRTGVDPADREELQPSEHPLAAAIQRPWDRGSAVSLSLALLGPYLIYGNSITDVQIGRSGAITFEPKDWRFCRPEMPWRDSLIGFVFDVDVPELEQSRSIDYVLHVADWSPTGPIGVSPLQQLGVTIQLEDAAQRFARATWQNGAKPATAITMSEEFLSWEPEQREAVYQQLREDVDTLHVGPDSAGRPALLPPGLSWAEIGQTTVEAGLIQQREVSRDEILAVYHLQPAALGVLHQQSRATIEVQREMTYMESLGPPMVLIEQAVTAQVAQNLLGESDLFVEYDFSQLLRGDRLSEIEALRGAIGSALMSPNEGRQALSMPKDPNPAMDEKYIPANNLQPIGTPPQRAGGVPEPVPPQQVPGAADRYGVWRPTPLRRPNDGVEEKDGAERHLYLPESALTGTR